MISVYSKLVGGLGNQLFQIAAGYSYALDNDVVFYIDSSGWSAHQGNNPESYKNTIFRNFDYSEPSTKFIVELHEAGFNYAKLKPPTITTSLHGYFQSVKYFKKYEDEFKKHLVLPEVDIGFMEPKNVAFHIRRGDYLQFKDVHYICDTQYFEKCFDMFKGYQINVFTDSPQHVLEEFKDRKFNLIESSSELNDLTIMSHHDNMVISNSSFSWWASLLGKKKNKIISPSKWFADGRESNDIFRDDFLKIDDIIS